MSRRAGLIVHGFLGQPTTATCYAAHAFQENGLRLFLLPEGEGQDEGEARMILLNVWTLPPAAAAYFLALRSITPLADNPPFSNETPRFTSFNSGNGPAGLVFG